MRVTIELIFFAFVTAMGLALHAAKIHFQQWTPTASANPTWVSGKASVEEYLADRRQNETIRQGVVVLNLDSKSSEVEPTNLKAGKPNTPQFDIPRVTKTNVNSSSSGY